MYDTHFRLQLGIQLTVLRLVRCLQEARCDLSLVVSTLTSHFFDSYC